MASKSRSFLKDENRDFNNILDSFLSINSSDSDTIAGDITISGATTFTGTSNRLFGTTATAAATDAAFYILNGRRGEIRTQLQGSIAVDTGFTIELRNTSIAADSLIVANVIGGDANGGGVVTGSVVTVNVVAANTASLNFYNSGAALADNAKFTASFAIID